MLREAADLLRGSEASDWAPLEPGEAAEILETEIESLEGTGRLEDRVVLESLFAPTASVQEISMAAGWSARFLELAGRFDEALGRLRRRLTPRAWMVNLALPVVIGSVILATVALSPAARAEPAGLGVGLALAVLSYLPTRAIVGRHTIFVSRDGVWLDDTCVPWEDVLEVRLFSPRYPLLELRLRSRRFRVRAVLRSGVLEAAQAVDEASGFAVEPELHGVYGQALDEYRAWRRRSLDARRAEAGDL